MSKNKLAIIGGSGLYDIEGLSKVDSLKIQTPWGDPSDEIVKATFESKEVLFLPRHGKGHFISPSKINFRANIDALKQLGATDIVSISAVGSLKEDLKPGMFVIVDQFIDRTFARNKTFFDEDIVAHVSMAIDTCATISSSKKVLFLAKVLSMNWSTITNIPGFRSSLRDPTADIDTISVAPSCFRASILALKLIFDGDMKCPFPCLGKNKTSFDSKVAFTISSDGSPHGV